MSTTAADTPTSNRPAVTWRDAVTPLSRASRRRWTACFALLLALLGAGFVSDTFAVERTGEQGTPIVLFVALPIVFGMLRRGTRRIAALDHPDLDERDITARNTAYRVAFPLLVLLMLATFVALAFALPGAVRHVRHPGVGVTELRDGWFLEPQALIGSPCGSGSGPSTSQRASWPGVSPTPWSPRRPPAPFPNASATPSSASRSQARLS